MRRRVFTIATAFYPRAWRARYAKELSDLCEEFVNAGETTQVRLVLAVLAAATLERLHGLQSSRHRLLLGASTAVVVALGAIALATNGFGLLVPALPTKGPVQSELLRLGEGQAQATSSLREPNGVILLARISVPNGVRAYVHASIPGGAGITIPTVQSGSDPSLSCQVSGGARVCTQAVEWCPMPKADWTLQVVKQSGPAGLVRVDFVIGPRPQA
jgi:hypothetical protein